MGFGAECYGPGGYPLDFLMLPSFTADALNVYLILFSCFLRVSASIAPL
jgi:hypothetical protein